MGIIIAITILVAIGAVIYFVGAKHSEDDVVEFLGGFVAIVSSLALVTVLTVLACRNYTFNNLQYRYDAAKAMVDSYQGFDYGNIIPLTDEMLKINHEIAKHKTYANTFWVGVFHSEELGNLEPLVFKNIYEVYE